MTNYDPYPAPHPSSSGPPVGERRLTRRTDDKMIAGVCSGLAAYLGVDATLVRLALVAAVVLGMGAGIVLYAVGWWLMPEA